MNVGLMLALIVSMLFPSKVAASQVREIEHEGARYALEFTREYTDNGPAPGAWATLLYLTTGLENGIPDYVEWEGIKYEVRKIDAEALKPHYPYEKYLSSVKYNGKRYNLELAPTPAHMDYFDAAALWLHEDGRYFPFTIGCYKGLDRFNLNQSVKFDKIICLGPCSDLSGFPYEGKYMCYQEDYYSNCYRLSDVAIGPLISVISNCFNVDESELSYEYRGLERAFTCTAPEPPTVSDSFQGWNNTDDFDGINAVLHVVVGHADKYRNAEVWKNFKEIHGDVDFAGNHVDAYTEVDGIYYGLYPDGTVRIIGPASRDITYADLRSRVYFDYYGYLDVTEIADFAFSNCKNLSRIYSPIIFKRIGDYAFYNCIYNYYYDGMLDIVPAKEIGDYAYAYTTVNHEFPEGIEKIGRHSFEMSFNLDFIGTRFSYAVVLPETLVEIGDYAFDSNWQGYVVIPSSVKKIGNFILGRDETQYIHFPNSNIKVFPNALGFSPGTRMEEFVFPESIEEFDTGSLCFIYNFNTKQIRLGQNVKRVQPFAYSGYVEDVVCTAQTPPQAWPESFGWKEGASCAKSMTLHVCKGLKSAYEVAEGWKEFGTIIDDVDPIELEQDGLIYRLNPEISEFAVVGMGNLENKTELNIPASVTYDGRHLPVTSIAHWALDLKDFDWATCKVKLPESLKTIEDFGIINPRGEWTSDAPAPPAVESKFAFCWPYRIGDSEFSKLYVPDNAVEAYKESPWWNWCFDIQPNTMSGTVEFESDSDSSEVVVRYSLDGCPITNPVPGSLYIEKYSDGTAKLRR